MTTTPKHTPGPWKIDGGTNRKGDLYIWIDGDFMGDHGIATVHGEIQEGARGNARLIAAAPELLEALQNTLKELQYINSRCGVKNEHGEWIDVDSTAIENALAAIKKATGEA